MKALALAALVACGMGGDGVYEAPTARDDGKLEESALHAMLVDREAAVNIEKITIEARNHAGRYRVTYKNRARKDAALAPFPGTLVDEIHAAAIPYSAMPEGYSKPDRKQKEISAEDFRESLAQREDAAAIESITIVPLGEDTARYDVMRKNLAFPTVVYAEYPGTIVKAITDAGIRFSVNSE